MTTKAWTPGPWTVEKSRIKSLDKRATIAEVSIGYLPSLEYRANRYLIAAAPDMAEALLKCLLVLSGEVSSKNAVIEALEYASSALKKARGE